jgi:hypothetical protein
VNGAATKPRRTNNRARIIANPFFFLLRISLGGYEDSKHSNLPISFSTRLRIICLQPTSAVMSIIAYIVAGWGMVSCAIWEWRGFARDGFSQNRLLFNVSVAALFLAVLAFIAQPPSSRAVLVSVDIAIPTAILAFVAASILERKQVR